MGFRIIKKGSQPKKATPPPRLVVTTKPPRPRREEMLWGTVGHMHRKDGTVERIESSVPRSEASPWLREEHEQRRRQKGA